MKRRSAQGSHRHSSPRKLGWPRRRLLGIALVVTLLLALFFGRTWIALVVRQRAASMSHDRPYTALSWLVWADHWGANTADNELLKARCYRRIGDFHQARRSLERAQSFKLNNAEYAAELLLQRLATAELPLSEQRIAAVTGNSLHEPQDIGSSLASGLLRSNRVAACWRVLEAWEADWPNDAQVHVTRGTVCLQLQMIAAAERELRQALTMNPAHELALLRLAELRLKQHRVSDAWQLLADATHDRPPHAGQLLLMARCQRLLGHPAAAWELLQRGNWDTEQNLEATSELGLTALEMGRLDAAGQYLQRAYQLSPDDGPHREWWATYLALEGRDEEAQRHFAALREARAETNRRQDARLREALENM